MKQIKIVKENFEDIQAILNSANGKATAHTYSDASDIFKLASVAESEIYELVGNRSLMRGAVVKERSGDALANAYRNSRICTSVELMRRSAGWYLVDVRSVTGYRESANSQFYLTVDQDAKIIANVRSKYSII